MHFSRKILVATLCISLNISLGGCNKSEDSQPPTKPNLATPQSILDSKEANISITTLQDSTHLTVFTGTLGNSTSTPLLGNSNTTTPTTIPTTQPTRPEIIIPQPDIVFGASSEACTKISQDAMNFTASLTNIGTLGKALSSISSASISNILSLDGMTDLLNHTYVFSTCLCNINIKENLGSVVAAQTTSVVNAGLKTGLNALITYGLPPLLASLGIVIPPGTDSVMGTIFGFMANGLMTSMKNGVVSFISNPISKAIGNSVGSTVENSLKDNEPFLREVQKFCSITAPIVTSVPHLVSEMKFAQDFTNKIRDNLNSPNNIGFLIGVQPTNKNLVKVKDAAVQCVLGKYLDTNNMLKYFLKTSLSLGDIKGKTVATDTSLVEGIANPDKGFYGIAETFDSCFANKTESLFEPMGIATPDYGKYLVEFSSYSIQMQYNLYNLSQLVINEKSSANQTLLEFCSPETATASSSLPKCLPNLDDKVLIALWGSDLYNWSKINTSADEPDMKAQAQQVLNAQSNLFSSKKYFDSLGKFVIERTEDTAPKIYQLLGAQIQLGQNIGSFYYQNGGKILTYYKSVVTGMVGLLKSAPKNFIGAVGTALKDISAKAVSSVSSAVSNVTSTLKNWLFPSSTPKTQIPDPEPAE